MKLVLVTGGTGFVGSHLIQLLLQHNYAVRAIYRKETSKFLTPIENQKVEWVQTDLFDVDALSVAMDGIDAVFHCAAIVSFDRRRKEELYKTNEEGTANVVNTMLAEGINNLLHLSSVAALGRNDKQEEINEKNTWEESKWNTQYAVSKYKAELEVRRGEAEGLKVSIINPGMIFGEGDWDKGSCAIFKRLYNGFPYYTKGINSFVDVQDVVGAMLLLYQKGDYGENYIISQGNYAYKDIFTWIVKGFGKKTKLKLAKKWMSDIVWRWYELKKYFSSKEQTITKETAHSAQSIFLYDNKKFLAKYPDFEYTPIQDCINRSCQYYLN